MAETKTISSKYIIQRALANHTFDDTNWFNDSVDWIGQAMRFIGKHAGFPTKICTDVYIENYHTPYPLGLEGILAIMYKGAMLPLGSDISGIGFERINHKFVQSNQKIANYDNILEINGLEQQKVELVELYAITPTQEIADKINYVAGRINALDLMISATNQYQYGRKDCEGQFYNTKQDTLQLSFEQGYIDIIYSAFPVDNEGFPLLIDNEYYIQAIEWYLILMLIQKGYQHPIFDWQKAYDMFFGDPNKRIIGWKDMAANNIRMPSIQDLERFTRMWEQFRVRRTEPIQLFNRTEQVYGLIY